MDTMSKSPADVHDLFRAAFGSRARAELVRCALQAHAASKNLVRQAGFSPDQAVDVLPYVRRADFETRLTTLVIPGVTAHVRRNQRGTSSFVELVTPDVCVTALTRSRLPRRLPKAAYRETRAEGSQVTISEYLGLEDGVAELAPRLYGTYVYGGRAKDSELSVARVYFPVPGLPLHAIPSLDLLAEHASMVDGLRAEAATARPMEATAEIVMGLKRKAEEDHG